MALGQKLICLSGVNTDLANQKMQPTQARFLKNLYYELTDTAESGTNKGANTGVMKPVESNAIYCPVSLPQGDNHVIGTYPSTETNELYVWVYNSQSNHCIFKINGIGKSAQIVYQGSCLNFKLQPEFFIHEGGAWLEVVYLINPETGEQIKKKDLFWTDGTNYQGYLRVDDSIDTNFFDANIFPYFSGNYDKCFFTRMGVPTPKDCIKVTEVKRTEADAGLNNNLLFNTWQWRVRNVDVYGRPSEWGMISDIYIPGVNDCLSNSVNIPRCVNLEFDAGDPTVNTIEIAFRNCNDEQWHLDNTLFLYIGSNIGKWWTRPRNPDIVYDPVKNTIIYTFCRDKECNVIPITETNRLFNPLPKTSQGLLKLNKDIALVNNKDGFNPFSQELIKNFSAKITPPKKVDISSRQITIYVPIYNSVLNNFQQVSKDGTSGYIWGDNNSRHGGARNYLQYFTNPQQSGFVGYLNDGSIAISTQVYLDASGNLIDDPEHNGINLSPFVNSRATTFQKFVFTAKQSGTYIFRLASHLSNPNTDANYAKTSTTVWGVVPFSRAAYFVDTGAPRPHSQELLIDVCNKDYDTLNENNILVILDTAAFTSGQSSKVLAGYVYETISNGYKQNPMELLFLTSGFGQIRSDYTDHNGFYYYGTRGNGRSFRINLDNKCVTVGFNHAQNGNTGLAFQDFIIDQTPGFSDFFTTLCNRVILKGRVVLNNTNIGVSNISVTITRGSSTITDDNGYFSLVAHDDVEYGTRLDKLVLGSSCNYTGIDGSCIEVKNVTIVKCSSCVDRIINISDWELEYKSERGLLSGGNYPLFVNGYDWIGRKTFAQSLGYLNIPSIIQSQAIGASKVEITINPTATFPSEIKYITFSISSETTIEKYLDWIVDRFDLIDSTGAINALSPTQIKIYYASVIEYSKVHEYNTTTAWQFIPQGQNTPAISDKVQFLLNGDGKFFTKTIIGLVKYDQTGQFFLIDYTSDLKDLKQNALIRLIRPKSCTGTEPCFEVCGRIDIINQKAQVNSFVLNAFDTYFLSRQIPVPAPVNPVPQTQTITTTTNNAGGSVSITQTPVPTSTVNELRAFGFRFEHNSPSNFWGDGCWNIGRVNAKNPYESELIHLNQIALSGALSINAQLNYLSYFDESKKTDFDVNNTGGIVYARPKQGILFVLTQYENFIVGYGDNIARVNSAGQVEVPSGANTFGKPERKTNGDFGCTLFDKNTIREKEGLIHWLDRNKVAVLQHNYSQCLDISRNNQANSTIVSWLTKKIKFNQFYNEENGNKKYFHAVINPSNFEYLLSDFEIGKEKYVNEERDYNVQVNETFAFSIFTQIWKGMYGFTPEYYGFLEGATIGQLLFSFTKAIPYSHSTTGSTSFMTFYGTIVEPMYRPVCCGDGFDKKKYMGLSVYCPQLLFFTDQILTENLQESRLLLSQFNKSEYFSFAPFLCDLNTQFDPNRPIQTGVNKLMDGDTLLGSWIDVRLIGQKSDKYFELFGITIEFFKSEKSGLEYHKKE